MSAAVRLSTEMQRVQPVPAAAQAAVEVTPSNTTPDAGAADTAGADSPGSAETTAPADARTRVVLGPARVKADSRVILVQFTINWLSNAFLALCVLLKANGTLHCSWWLAFMPAWVGHSIHLPFQIVCLLCTDRLILKQLGAPPPDPTLQIHYELVKSIRAKGHMIDTANSAVEGVFHAIAKGLFCYALTETWGHELHGDYSAFKVVFLPLCASWVTTTLLSLYKDKGERVCGSVRDMQFVLMLFIAFKLDGRNDYPWRVVFLILWLWFCVLFLLTTVVMVVIMGLRARGARVRDILLPIGILALLLSAAPQFMSYYYLASRLDGDSSISYSVILLPNAVSWFAMWLSGLIIAAGLRRKEQARAALLASGALWANPDDLMLRQLQQQAMLNVQQKVDAMSEEEVAALVDTLMQGKVKPVQLLRVGQSLFRRIAEAAEAQLQQGSSEAAADTGAESKLALLSSERSTKDAVIDIRPEAAGHKPGPLAGRADDTSVASSSQAGVQMAHQHSWDEEAGLIPAVYVRSSDDGVPEAVGLRGSSPSPSSRPSADGANARSHRAPSRHPSRVHAGPSRGVSRSLLTAAVQEHGLQAHIQRHHTEEADTCIICFDGSPDCVFLECGHGGICRSCGNRLFARPPHECPTCRQKIVQIVQLESMGSVGEVVRVKQ